MDRSKAIKLLRQKIIEAVGIASQPYDSNEHITWLRNIEDILESEFGVTSTEYKRVARIPSETIFGTRAELQLAYKQRIHRIQQEVDSIIQKYEILGLDRETGELIKKPIEETRQKNTNITPIQLFDAMQFHQNIVKASRALFKNEHYAEAIFAAFKAVENFVRKKTKLPLYGKHLMAQAFNEDNPLIEVTEGGIQNKEVQEGFKFMFMGAMLAIRNPKAHDDIVQTDPFITLEYLSFASFLLKRIEGWQSQ